MVLLYHDIPYVPTYCNNDQINSFNRENLQFFPKKRDFSMNISNLFEILIPDKYTQSDKSIELNRALRSYLDK